MEQKFGKRSHFIRETLGMIVLTVLMYLIINLVVQSYDIQGPSMEPTLHSQERIIVDKVSYWFYAPARSDVVIFKAPNDPSLSYVKRIIGIPGDVITVENTTVKVDGVTLQEPYVDPQRQGNPYNPIIHRVVPPNNYFVMGDDRINSSDSRDWGFVPRENIIGRATFVYWPLNQDNNGFLSDFSSVFARVHQNNPSTSVMHSNRIASRSDLGVEEMFLCVFPALLLCRSRYRKRKRVS